MMKSILGILLLTFSCGAFAKVKKVERDFIKCARSIIESKRLNKDILSQLKNQTERFKTTDTFELLEECRQLQIDSQAEEKKPLRPILNAFQEIYGKDYHYSLLWRFYAPKYQCTRSYGLGAQVAIMGAVSAHLLFGVCTSTTGRRFQVILPGGAIGEGLGAFVYFRRGPEIDIDSRHQILVENNELGFEGGIIIAGDECGYKMGLGLGVMMLDYEYSLKINMPLPPNYSRILKILKK